MPKINLNEFKDRKGKESIEIETDDETFVVASVDLWTDEQIELSQRGMDANLELSVSLIGGPDVYARFVRAGGNQSILGAIIKEATKGVKPGK